jgi:hypothetical protein
VGNLTAIAISEECRFCLKKLDLSFCRNMDDNALGLIVDSCSSLKTLKLFGCSQVLCINTESQNSQICYTSIYLEFACVLLVDFSDVLSPKSYLSGY